MSIEVKDFNKEVIEQSYSIPVLVDFWAEWCAPCRMLGPVLEKVAEKNKDKFILAKLDTDANQDVAMKYGIRGIPNVKLFIKGEPVDEFQGALPEKMVEEWLEKALPSEQKELLQHAKNIMHANPDEAKVILQKIILTQPEKFEPKVLLAKILLFEDSEKAKELVSNYENELELTEEASAIFTIAEVLEKKKNHAALQEDAVKEKYLSAIDDLSKKKFDSALDKFISKIRENRQYDNDGSRKACIAVFKYLGEENATTIKYRRPFGSALYV